MRLSVSRSKIGTSFFFSYANTASEALFIEIRKASSPSKRCTKRAAKYVAKPSLNHRSDHVDSVTSSPNHWCAISCATTLTLPIGIPYVLLSLGDDDPRVNRVLVKTIALEFSIPPKRVAPTINASFSYG